MQLLPPSPDRCQCCAQKHEPEQPHDATSLFYGFWFLQQHGRSPTWADAMAHCAEPIKFHWTLYLNELGIDINSTKVRGDLKSQSDMDARLNRVEGDR